MLRITVHDVPGAFTLRLEGSLAVPWLHALEECWQDILARRRKSVFSVDLTGVTSIDAAGKTLLATMADRGATLLAADCLIRSIVDEIARTALPDHSNPRSRR
jgi:anti-anti-sigma regulatory factor